MYYLVMLAAASVFASNIWVINAAQSNGWIPFFLSFCSYGLSSITLLNYAIIRKVPFLTIYIWSYAAKPAVILLLANFFLILSVKWSTPERIGFIVGLTVIFVPILQFFLQRTKIPKVIYFSLFLALLGNTILNYDPKGVILFNIGDIFALLTTLCYALSIIWIKECSDKIPVVSFILIQSIISCLGYIPIVALTGSFQNITELPLFPMFFIGFISFVVANALQFIAQKNIPSEMAAIILASTSIIGMFIGAIFFGLKLTLIMVFAAILFCAASIIGALNYD